MNPVHISEIGCGGEEGTFFALVAQAERLKFYGYNIAPKSELPAIKQKLDKLLAQGVELAKKLSIKHGMRAYELTPGKKYKRSWDELKHKSGELPEDYDPSIY
jgi:hypothetical protein